MKKTDFLIIGSGIAGLSFALKAAAHGKVCIITKANEEESNTKYAQGGVAVVIDKADSYANHINDTLIAGDGCQSLWRCSHAPRSKGGSHGTGRPPWKLGVGERVPLLSVRLFVCLFALFESFCAPLRCWVALGMAAHCS